LTAESNKDARILRELCTVLPVQAELADFEGKCSLVRDSIHLSGEIDFRIVDVKLDLSRCIDPASPICGLAESKYLQE
jgi:hypothetical protein